MAVQLKYSDNWNGLKAEYKKIADGTNRHYTATISNTAYFAPHLHNRSGFYVFNDERAAKTINREIKNLMNLGLDLTEKRVKKALERGILKYIEYLRSYTGGSRPGFRNRPGRRKAHPGGWADRTGYLNNKYRYRINNGRWKRQPEWKSGLSAARTQFQQIYGKPPRN